MNYVRREVKFSAKTSLRETDPRHWLVTLVYVLLTNLPSVIIMTVALRPVIAALSMQTMGYPSEHVMSVLEQFFGAQGLLILFLGVLLALFNAVLGFGYRRYCMNVYRRQESGYGDIFHGFGMAGRVISLELLIALFTFLWGLVAFAIVLGGVLLTTMIAGAMAVASYGYGVTTGVMVVIYVLVGLSYLGGIAFLYSRILRYEMAPFLLVDHPEWSATDALNESKSLMKGRRWSLVVLELSFFGWQLLDLTIFYGILFGGAYAMDLGFLQMSGVNFNLMPYYIMYSGIGGILLYLASRLLALPLDLWLLCYQTAARAGFYDAIRIPQAPPLQAGPGGSYYGGFSSSDVAPPPPPPPSQDDGPAGSFYSGFAAPEAPKEPEPPEEPKKDDPWADIDTKGPDLPE